MTFAVTLSTITLLRVPLTLLLYKSAARGTAPRRAASRPDSLPLVPDTDTPCVPLNPLQQSGRARIRQTTASKRARRQLRVMENDVGGC